MNDFTQIFFALIMGGIPIASAVYIHTGNLVEAGLFGWFATFLIALIIEGNTK